MSKIAEFQGEHRFLSNFWPAEVALDGVRYPTVENAFQAAKTLDPQQRRQFETCSPAEAKRLGRRVTLRKDWNAVRVDVMSTLVLQKFVEHPALAARLKATGKAELEEGNRWNDRFWGVCGGVGANWLGRILMAVRASL